MVQEQDGPTDLEDRTGTGRNPPCHPPRWTSNVKQVGGGGHGCRLLPSSTHSTRVWAEREQPAPHIFTPGTREEMQKHLPPHPSSKQTMSSFSEPHEGDGRRRQQPERVPAHVTEVMRSFRPLVIKTSLSPSFAQIVCTVGALQPR